MRSFWILLAHLGFLLSAPINNNTETVDDELAVNDLWTGVERRVGQPDLITPSLCPSPCRRLFHAIRISPTNQTDGEECRCQCPPEYPIFQQSISQCVKKIDLCLHPILDSESRSIPVVELPQRDQFINFPSALQWQQSRAKVKSKIGARCNITAVNFLRQERQWQEASTTLFRLGWNDGTAGIQFDGDEEERDILYGTIIRINLDCVGAESHSHCLTFAVAGYLSFPSHWSGALGQTESRILTVVIILLLILLFLSFFGCPILWKMCWRMEKSKLISTFQMQFLYHMKQEKERTDLAHHYQQLAANGKPILPRGIGQYGEIGGPLGNTSETSEDHYGNNQSNIVAKRKLYFSTDFFEPHLMQNPPPMADQFLQDLRKMIEIAKQRINLRKHVPNLGSIAEEPIEEYQNYMRKSAADELPAPSSEKSANSPRSTKSADSGHESDSEATASASSTTSSTSSALSETPKPAEPKSPPIPPPKPQIPKAPLASPEESPQRSPPKKSPKTRLPTPTDRTPVTARKLSGPQNPQRIPQLIPTLGQKSPRPPPRAAFTVPGNPNRFLPPENSPPPLPPRNPPPSTPPKAFLQLSQQRIENAKRKAYAVFPSTDSMLKKSLPRRTKRQSPQLSESVETKM